MATPGWYPDPASRSGHFRYWNGATWSDKTTTNPQQPPPSSTGPGQPAAGRAGKQKPRLGWLVLIAVVVVLTLGIALLVRHLGSESTTTSYPAPTASSTVSAWDETSTPSACR